MLQRGGYEIKILNTINFKQSMRYNPFKYIYCENDILKLVNCIMENTKGEDSKGGEDFWAKAEALYYQSLIAYIWYEAPEEEKNMTTLLEMLNASEVREDDENFKNAVDLMFEQLQQRDPEHFAVRQYVKYKMARALLKNVKTQEVFKKREVKVRECRNCGHIVVGSAAPDICPVCAHPQAYFEVHTENY